MKCLVGGEALRQINKGTNKTFTYTVCVWVWTLTYDNNNNNKGLLLMLSIMIYTFKLKIKDCTYVDCIQHCSSKLLFNLPS